MLLVKDVPAFLFDEEKSAQSFLVFVTMELLFDIDAKRISKGPLTIRLFWSPPN